MGDYDYDDDLLDDIDDYNDEDDDSYEDEGVKNGKRKGKKLTRKKEKKNKFIDDAAEESDNDEEDYEKNSEIRMKNRQDEQLYKTRKNKNFEEVIDDIAHADIQQRYRHQEDDYDYDDDEDMDLPDNLKNQYIKVRPDQKIFTVPVRKTKEKEVVICLLNKFAQLNPQHNFGVYSISYVPSSESIIYIEGRSKRDVLTFLDKYPDVNTAKVELVNNDEFMGIYQDKEQEKFNVEVGMYVRISTKAKNSDYINDFGQIHEIKKNNKVMVKLIPRVNIEQMIIKSKENQKKRRNNQDSSYVEVDGNNEEENKQNKKPFNKYGKAQFVPSKSVQEIENSRPDPQFFSLEEYGNDFENHYRAVSELYEPELPDENSHHKGHCGYVYKIFNCKDLILNQQPRSLQELKKFYPHLEIEEIMNRNSKFLKMASYQTNFVIGDSVMINGGQMKGVKGKIISLGKETAKVSFKKNKTKIEEEVELKYLVKHFEDGSRVKVISGASEGITGSVLSTEGEICFVFTDNNNTIEVRTKDLAITGETGQDVDRNNGNDGGDKNLDFKKKDLVKLTGFNHVGIILDINKDFIKILDQNGKVRNVNSYSINTKLDTRKYISKNAEGSNITNNSNIIIKNGQFAGYQCQVIHVFKSFVFLFNPKFRDTYTVENINNVSLQTTNPVVQRQEARIAYDMKYGKEDGKPGDMKQYVGRQMKIIGGQYKGFQCTVLDIRNEQIKVEINSKFITVFISKNDLIAPDRSNAELDYGKTPSYVTQSTYQPSIRDTSIGSPAQY